MDAFTDMSFRALALLGFVAALSCSGNQTVPDEREIDHVLDDWHAAAAAADEARYFSHFAADGIFLGTDPEERWTVEQFRAYAHPYFAAGKGWSYLPRDRNVRLAADGSLAWFDERLKSPKYGELRGSGVLRREGRAFKIVQYSMTFTIPNSKTASVVALIGEDGPKPGIERSK